MRSISSAIRAAGLVAGLLAVLAAGPAAAGLIVFTTHEDGDNLTQVTPSEALNTGSSLTRIFHVVEHHGAPVHLDRAGIDSRHHAGDDQPGDERFVLHTEGQLIAKEAVKAVRIVFALFDVFDRPMRTLSLTLVRDIAAGSTIDLTDARIWTAIDDAHRHEARDLLTVVAAVSSVRLETGTVWSWNSEAVAREMARLGLVHGDDLEVAR